MSLWSICERNGSRRNAAKQKGNRETYRRHPGHATGEIGVEVLALLQRHASWCLHPARQIGEQIIEPVPLRVDDVRQVRRVRAEVRGPGCLLVGERRGDGVGQLRGPREMVALLVGAVLYLLEVAWHGLFVCLLALGPPNLKLLGDRFT